ncbi:organic cation transporter protein [Stomoxys calcitrans]|uniref:Major facilitator superfamily (MFS) profile domain-containing protein n=1 Tax=Stomoxys calcitrans TaxID=35570 RepID=A0A1I8Q6Z6_STOCA|nr:organic cation transporter protein [Stomoxys calcitrans]
MTQDQGEKSKAIITEEAYKEIVTNELERVGTGGLYVWSLFFICVLPNILNGFHVNSYTMLGHLPDDQWCEIDDLRAANWTNVQKRTIAHKDLTTKGCTIRDWDYKHLSSMSFEEAYNYTSMQADIETPNEISCKAKGIYHYAAPDSTFVANWDLVCDRAIQRTSAQVFVSLGKFLGSFTFGMISDKFGRKTSFTLGAAFFMISSIFCTFSPWYSLFLIGRFGLGAASSGLFYAAYAMLMENICLKHRSWMSLIFSGAYPIGMILLAIFAYLLDDNWRYLQLALTVPAMLLLLNCYIMNESPRWLITQKRFERAYKILFKKPSHYEIVKPAIEQSSIVADKKIEEPTITKGAQIRDGALKHIVELFATSKIRKLVFISYFMFCASSLTYYVTALNASNLAVSRYLYVIITGFVDLPSLLLPVLMLRFTGRRVATMTLFAFTGCALIMVMVVPQESTVWIVAFAMLGRFGITATYAVVTLYAAELFPTEIRGTALGTCSTWAHVGSISAPYAVDFLGPLGWYIPTTICGVVLLVASLLTLLLPETGTGKLTDRVEEVPSETSSNNESEEPTKIK